MAAQYCTHIIYGYVGIQEGTYYLMSLNEGLDLRLNHFSGVTSLKKSNPQLKILLSLGGSHDLQQPERYLSLLEAGRDRQRRFIESAVNILQQYGFDGLDLAFPLPRNKPRKVHSDLSATWKSFKKLITGDFIVDERAAEHREEFTDLVKNIKNAFQPLDLMLSLTVLPNVNSSWYYDARAIILDLDFVNLAAFDFLTPTRNPVEADYTAPLYALADQNRLGYGNVNFQVDHWLKQRVPGSKLNLGIATYGQAWKMSKDSGIAGLPVVTKTNGAAAADFMTHKEGILSWPEICLQLSKSNGKTPLTHISDPLRRYNSYAFRPGDEHGEHGIWVSYDDPETAADKANFIKTKNLGGAAVFDITMDDSRGQCTGEKFPILKTIKKRLS